MLLEIAERLSPEVRPLAWLVGQWRGRGELSYPGIDRTSFIQDLVIDDDGGPYLRATTTIYLTPDVKDVDPTARHIVSDDEPRGQLWSTETAYWRVPPQDRKDSDPLELEVLVADPSGHLSVYVGQAQGGRVDLASDLIARTETAAAVSAGRRLFGQVDGDLMWVWEMAALGQELQPYVSARLSRVDAPESEPSAEDGVVDTEPDAAP